jgi:hypothetical protein
MVFPGAAKAVQGRCKTRVLVRAAALLVKDSIVRKTTRCVPTARKPDVLIAPMPGRPESDDRRATRLQGRWNPNEVWLDGCTGSSTFTHVELGL